MSNNSTIFLGSDLARNHSHLAILDPYGDLIEKTRVSTSKASCQQECVPNSIATRAGGRPESEIQMRMKRELDEAKAMLRLDEFVLDELALHLRVLSHEFKRYIQSPRVNKKAQQIFQIHKQDEVWRFCKEVGFRRRDRAKRASKFLAESLA